MSRRLRHGRVLALSRQLGLWIERAEVLPARGCQGWLWLTLHDGRVFQHLPRRGWLILDQNATRDEYQNQDRAAARKHVARAFALQRYRARRVREQAAGRWQP